MAIDKKPDNKTFIKHSVSFQKENKYSIYIQISSLIKTIWTVYI